MYIDIYDGRLCKQGRTARDRRHKPPLVLFFGEVENAGEAHYLLLKTLKVHRRDTTWNMTINFRTALGEISFSSRIAFDVPRQF